MNRRELLGLTPLAFLSGKPKREDKTPKPQEDKTPKYKFELGDIVQFKPENRITAPAITPCLKEGKIYAIYLFKHTIRYNVLFEGFQNCDFHHVVSEDKLVLVRKGE